MGHGGWSTRAGSCLEPHPISRLSWGTQVATQRETALEGWLWVGRPLLDIRESVFLTAFFSPYLLFPTLAEYTIYQDWDLQPGRGQLLGQIRREITDCGGNKLGLESDLCSSPSSITVCPWTSYITPLNLFPHGSNCINTSIHLV